MSKTPTATVLAARSFSRHLIRRSLHGLLKTPLFTANPVYQSAYYRNVRRKIPGMLKANKRVIIEITNHCNISCTFCINEKIRRPKGIMDNTLFESIIDQCAKRGTKQVLLFGLGEPLLDDRYLEKVAYTKKRGIADVHCVTNGIRLNQRICDGLVDAQIDYVGISLDAATPETYRTLHKRAGGQSPADEFHRVADNIQRLCETKRKAGSDKPWIEVRFKDIDQTRKDLLPLIRRFSGWVNDIGIYMNITAWYESEDASTKCRRNGHLVFPCSDLWSTLYICWDGRVAPCCKDYECTECLGNLTHDTLEDIWQGDKLGRLRNHHLSGNFHEIPICKNCDSNVHTVMPWWFV